MYCHMSQWLKTGFGLVIGFINHLQVITTILLLNTIYNHLTLIFSVYFHRSSLSVSWQQIYNTGTIKVSLNYTLPILMYYCTHKVYRSHTKSSQADFLYSSVLLKFIACLLYSSSLPLYSSCLLLSLGILLTYIDTGQSQTYRKHITWLLSSQSIGALTGPTQKNISREF
jgi:hypothetical protein